MTKKLFCPNCRSELRAHGSVNFNAPAVNILGCPVCDTPIHLPAGLMSVHYDRFEVIKKETPVLNWQDLKKKVPGLESAEINTYTDPIYKFESPQVLKTAYRALGKYALPMTVVISGIILIKCSMFLKRR